MDANVNKEHMPNPAGAKEQNDVRQGVARENAAAAQSRENASDLVVGGFLFASPEDAKLAAEELNKVEYLDQKMNYRSPENTLAVYNKVLENKMLKTPPGYDYLRRMQQLMLKEGIAQERIEPIPIYHRFAPKESSEFTEGIAKQRIERQLKKEKSESARYKQRYHGAMWLCLFLFVMVMAMFYMAMKSDNPNILNYENVLVNKYAAWEQELLERESVIREKERALE